MPIFQISCPECKSTDVDIVSYQVHCRRCGFTANKGGMPEITEKERDALLLLSSHGGKVLYVYATLSGIPIQNAQQIMSHPNYSRTRYQHLLNFYNSLGTKCNQILQKKGVAINLDYILSD